MDNEFLILLQAGLDEAASKGLINDDIKNKLQGKINQLQLTAIIDGNSISAIKGQLEKILNHSITISNINIDTGQAAKNAQQAGQNIGKQIQNGINSVVQKGDFKTEFTFSDGKRNSIVQDTVIKEFEKISNGIITVKEQMKQVGKESLLDGFIVNIKKANGEVENLTYRLKDMLDAQGRATEKKAFNMLVDL